MLVEARLLCPSNSFTAFNSAPLFNILVANECLNTWGLHFANVGMSESLFFRQQPRASDADDTQHFRGKRILSRQESFDGGRAARGDRQAADNLEALDFFIVDMQKSIFPMQKQQSIDKLREQT